MNWFKKQLSTYFHNKNSKASHSTSNDVEQNKTTDSSSCELHEEKESSIVELSKIKDKDENAVKSKTASEIAYLSNLNKQQLASATYSGQHLLVLAGAGTGKTRTIIARAIYLISNGINPNRIKILSFTKKSAQEIATRIKIEGNIFSEAKHISGSTFHSWCMELITRYNESFGMEGYSCIDEDDRESAIKIAIGTVYNKKEIKIRNERYNATTISNIYSYSVNTRQNLSSAIKAIKFPMMNGKEIEAKVSEIKEYISPVIKSYIEYKRSRRYIDYDDMLLCVASILKENSDLRQYISSLYDHILIDEMQDTNPLQWMLIESFMDKCHLFCVGDDAQSIYGFRGADFKSIHSFVERVPNSDVYKLEENYRSTQEILDLSNWLLDESPLKYNKHLFAHRGKGKKPIMQFVNNDWEEAEFVTDDIIKNIAQGKQYKNHMILSRSVYASRKIEAACISKKIPFVVFGGTTLMRSAHVRDVVSALRIIANFRDELAWMRYLTLWPRIGEITASKLIEKMFGYSSLNECIETTKSTFLNENIVSELLNNISNLEQKPDKAIDIVVSALDNIMAKRYENWDARKKDFAALKIVAKRADNISSFITEYILDPIAELSNVLEKKDDNDKVVISTIHSAKGLESEICYIASVMPGMFPSHKAETDEDIEEERRCLYVALTRAKDKLFLMSYLSSNTAIRGNRIYIPKIVDVKNENNTGILCGTIRNYNKNHELESVLVTYRMDTQPDQILKMEEEIFWEHFKRAPMEYDEERAYFFNNLPNNLVEKVMAGPQSTEPQQYAHPRVSKEFNPFDNFDFN